MEQVTYENAIHFYMSQVVQFFKLYTGVRDYIHVMDLASGHVAALAKVEKDKLRYRV